MRLWWRADKRALVVTVVCLVIWRLLEQIPVTDVTPRFITTELYQLGNGPGFFAAIGPNSIPFAAWSVGYEGIGPYLEALILMSLIPAVSARIRNMARNRRGRDTLARWTRVLALGLAMGQAYGFTVLYQYGSPPVFGSMDWSARLAVCLALSGGTALMILLADALDEFGLGFGCGAVILYALGPLATEVHRLAGYFAAVPSLDALYKPIAIWAAVTLALTVGSVAIVLAVQRTGTTEIRFLIPGVLRPPQIAATVLALPTIAAGSYYAKYPAQVQWIYASWQFYFPNGRPNVALVLIYVALIVLIALFVVAIDDLVVPVRLDLRPHLIRLALISGLFLALLATVVPVANHLLTQAAGELIPISGSEVLLVVAVILLSIRAVEGYRPVVPYTASPSALP